MSIDAVWVKLAVYNEKLYAAWAEANDSGVYQLRVTRTSDGSVWEFVDGDGTDGLNKDPKHLRFTARFRQVAR